jgi:hypothetical protein
MRLSTEEKEFLAGNHSAAMTSLRKDGSPHTVRVGVALVDGRLMSSGTVSRARTAHLRRDSRSTLFVFEGRFRYLTIEAEVTILDGPGAAELHLPLMRTMQGRPADSPTIGWYGTERTPEEFVAAMRAEGRLIYRFDVLRTYGLLGAPGR